MLEKQMMLLAKKHKDWIRIVKSFGCNYTISEDIVQEMYIKIHYRLKDGLNIMYNEDEINYYYVYRTLQTLFYDLKRKEKNITLLNIDDVNIETTISDVDYKKQYDIIEQELSKMFWYDRKVFEIINDGESIAEFSRKSHIHYYSLYNTYNKVKERLKKLL
jgi:DNA-directed RNA polymerase specialized sigma24 family protein